MTLLLRVRNKEGEVVRTLPSPEELFPQCHSAILQRLSSVIHGRIDLHAHLVQACSRIDGGFTAAGS